jgi:amino acid adenylation domain-containing protein
MNDAALASPLGDLAPASIARRDGANALLSHTQRLLWLYEQSVPGTPIYNVPLLYEVDGAIDVDALKRALNALVERHEILGYRFDERDAEPFYAGRADVGVDFSVIDLSGIDARKRSSEADRLMRAAAYEPFHLSCGPLWRAVLLRLTADTARLAIVFHHIAYDVWSEKIVTSDLAECYAAAIAGRAAQLDPLPIQYADYAGWERERIDAETLASLAAFWRRQLADAPALLALPTDRPPQPVRSFEADQCSIFLPEGFASAVRALGRKRGCTLFVTMMAAFQTLLHRYSGQDVIVIGGLFAGRDHRHTRALIGYFARLLAFPGRFSEDQSFSELLRATHATKLDVLKHGRIPVEEFAAARPGDSGEPIVRALLTISDKPQLRVALGDATLTKIESQCVSAFDLSLDVCRVGEGLRATMLYRTDLFDRPTIERMLGHFQTLLEGAVANPDLPVSALPLLTQAERAVQQNWNATDVPYRRGDTIVDLLREQAARAPEAIAVQFEADTLTYRELDRRGDRLGAYLHELGVQPGAVAAVFIERSIDMIVAVFGVQRAGAAYLPIDPLDPPERIAFMLEDADVTLVVTQDSLRDRLPSDIRVVSIDGERDAIRAFVPSASPPAISPSDLAYVIYTSGSTGRPKGVLVEHRNLMNSIAGKHHALALGPADTVLASHPLAFDSSVSETFVPLTCGARMLIVSRETASDPQLLIDVLTRERPTFMDTEPSLWRMLIEAGWRGARGLHIMSGAEALSQSLADQLLERADVLWNSYGPTEATISATLQKLTPGVPVSIGRPNANVTVYILDPHLEPLPVGATGQLYIGGDGVARGYLNRPELTAEKFVHDPFAAAGARMYRTGDLARFRAEGTIEYLGRADFQVKLRGYRIELGEIEKVMTAHASVRQAYVMLRHDAGREPALCGYYLARTNPHDTGNSHSAIALREHLRAALPSYMVPGHLVELAELPLTKSGKVDRAALAVPTAALATATFVEPATAAERVVAGIFGEVLGTGAPVGADDDFFELGGHSILAMRLAAHVGAMLRVQVPLRTVFEHPTARGVSEALIAAEPAPGRIDTIARTILALQGMSSDERAQHRARLSALREGVAP